MGISLNGLTPAGTYPGLIKTGDNTAISGTPKVLSDGNGNNLPMEVSTTGVNFTNQLQQGGVAVPTQANLAAKQDTLVSGTNIKTINGTSVLGSGNITTPNVSGVAGAIQFSNGSAFASDASNLFWDDANNRLGVGTNAPTATAHFRGIGNTISTTALLVQNSSLTDILSVTDNAFVTINSGLVNIQTNGVAAPTGGAGLMFNLAGSGQGMSITNQNAITYRIGQYAASNVLSLGNSSAAFNINTSSNIGIGLTNPTARTHIQGSGSTSATTSLLVQNSAGTQMFRVDDNNRTYVGSSIILLGTSLVLSADVNNPQLYITGGSNLGINAPGNNGIIYGRSNSNNQEFFGFSALGSAIGSSTLTASAVLAVNSTTQGFLPPRMTTTQKNAIASPAAGLVVYDSTTNKLCCYNGSTWNDLF
jgi:hypothetical protein